MKFLSYILVLLLLSLIISGCSSGAEKVAVPAKTTFRVGYADSPLLGILYAAEKRRSPAGSWESRSMASSGDVGYALASGKLEAGFVETAKAVRLLKSVAGKDLKLAGALSYPYGAVLVMRKGLNIHLDELPGKTLAAEDADCKLFHQFKRDVQRQGIDPARITFRYIPFADMLPALEAGAVDGVVTKGAYAVLAEARGHDILYQNWELKPGGDECCPVSLAQIEYFLVVRNDAVQRLKPLIDDLESATSRPPAEIRRVLAERLNLDPARLGRFPVASFEGVSDAVRRDVGDGRCLAARK